MILVLLLHSGSPLVLVFVQFETVCPPMQFDLLAVFRPCVQTLFVCHWLTHSLGLLPFECWLTQILLVAPCWWYVTGFQCCHLGITLFFFFFLLFEHCRCSSKYYFFNSVYLFFTYTNKNPLPVYNNIFIFRAYRD